MHSVTTIFDLDGTLGDHDAAVLQAARTFYGVYRERLGGEFDDFLARWRHAARWYQTGHAGHAGSDQAQRRKRIREVFPEPVRDGEADALFAVYYEAYAASWTLYPDAWACLERRKRLGPLGLITNGSTLSQRDKLKTTGIDRWLDFIVISAEVGCAKPDARIFEHALRFHPGDRKDAVFVGDSLEHDIAGAAGVGLPAVWINRISSDSAPGNVRCIGSLDEL